MSLFFKKHTTAVLKTQTADTNVNLKSKWLSDCLCSFLNKKDCVLTRADLEKIKYIRISTSNDYELELSDHHRFLYLATAVMNMKNAVYINSSVNKFIKIDHWDDEYQLILKKSALEKQKQISHEDMEKIMADSREFEKSLVKFDPYDGMYIKKEYEEDAENETLLNTDDFKQFSELEGLRFMDCCIEIHKIDFLKKLPKLRFLELGTISLENTDGLEKLKDIAQVCIWSN
ncbi:hypothetical protein [uncultured Clostridium sp.]|uniref:hypothetical protein n=1 Tax=uncultured Clostridium sp. TaxID=59620 RepID=UPI0025EEF91C|nr:hypothetical protein [uncultured Clostridium sp.]